MAVLDLRVDYKDDILDSSVNTKRKYNIIENEDGTKSLEDVSVYTQNGDSFGAADINKTNQAVLDLNSSLRKYNSTLIQTITSPTDIDYNLDCDISDYDKIVVVIKGSYTTHCVLDVNIMNALGGRLTVPFCVPYGSSIGLKVILSLTKNNIGFWEYSQNINVTDAKIYGLKH